MATSKIRSIKPESGRSETLESVSVEAALLFARLPCFCDDEGRQKYSPKLIKSDIFPLRDSIDEKRCGELIEELAAVGLVVVYEADSKRFLAVTNFKEHQHPTRPKESDFPAPPGDIDCISVSTLSEQCCDNARTLSQQRSNGSGSSNGNGSSNGSGMSRFAPPTPIEVASYAQEKNLTLDAERFCDFYASKGWKVGTTSMRDWKAAVRNWARRNSKEVTLDAEIEQYASRI